MQHLVHVAELNEIEAISKCELHIHLGGSYPYDFLKNIANEDELADLDSKRLKCLNNQLDSYHEAFSLFPLVSRIVNTNKRVRDGMASLCIALQNENVTYVEMRSGLKNLNAEGYESYLLAMFEGISMACKPGFECTVILSLRRDTPPDVVVTTVDLAIKYKYKGVVGIDISGDSTLGDFTQLAEQVCRARKNGLPLTLHIGESQHEYRQIEELKSLQPERVGHCVLLSDKALSWILTHRIPVEVCLTSSVLAKMTSNHQDHPWMQRWRNCGHPIAICTDDPLIFNTTVSKELKLVADHLQLGIKDIQILVDQSMKLRFR